MGAKSSDADVAAGGGAVFYVDTDRGTAQRVDPTSRKAVGEPVRVADHPGAAIVAANALWVTDTGRAEVARLEF